MTALACLAAWLGASALVCWIAGRFIRVGMVELQPERQDHLEKRTVTVAKPPRYYRAAQSRTADPERGEDFA